MTRKDYTKFAEMFRSVSEEFMPEQTSARFLISSIAEECALIFKADNGRFDKDRFLAACEAKS